MGKNKINRSTRKKKRKEKRHERNLSDSCEKKGNKRKLVGRISGSSIEVSLSVSTGMIENLFLWEPQHYRVHVFRISPLEDLTLFIGNFDLWYLRLEKMKSMLAKLCLIVRLRWFVMLFFQTLTNRRRSNDKLTNRINCLLDRDFFVKTIDKDDFDI